METAEQRSARWIAELDEVDLMTRDELLQENRRIAAEGGFAGCVAGASIRILTARQSAATRTLILTGTRL